MANIITNYRRIQNWENFFMDSALYSVANSIGIEYDNGFTPIAAITGDLFTYMYSDKLPCDSGLTNYIIMPEVVLKAYDSFGWNCVYLSREDVNRDLTTTMQKIKSSVDRGLPVLAWGVGGVVCADGTRYDPMGEGALIGGYDGNVLLIHLYCGAERLAPVSYGGHPGVDEYGYTAIPAKDALAMTNGLFILTEEKELTDVKTVFRDAIMSIPKWLTLPETMGYSFGKVAFDHWAEVLLDDATWRTPEQCGEDSIWNRHCSAFCSLCTSAGSFGGASRVEDYLSGAKEACPDLAIISELIPHDKRMRALTQQLWDIHGGFMPSPSKIQEHAYRVQLAAILRQMGCCCDDILNLFT